MSKKAFTIILIIITYTAFGRIGNTVKINPASPLSTDTIYIKVFTGYGDFIFVYDTSLYISNDTIFINSCHLLVNSSTQPPSSDSFQYAIGSLHPGLWTIKSVAHGTDTLYDSSCTYYTQYDSAIKSFTVDPTGNIEIQDEANNIIICPNPTKQYLTGNIKTIPQILTAEIISPDGKVLKSDITINGPSFQIDVSALSAGVYFLVAHNGEEKLVKRFVKE